MIKAFHKKWVLLVFNHYLSNLFKWNFSSINVCNDVPETNQKLPLVIIANHSSWWDAFIIFFLNGLTFKRKFYVLTLEETLLKFKFFRKLGAFSIDLSNPVSQKAAIKYCSEILNNDSSALITLFPQGKLELNNQRPLNFKKGLKYILNLSLKEVQILPLSIKLIFLNEKKPSIFIYYGKLLSKLDIINNYDMLENEVVSNLNLIDSRIIKKEFQEILNKRHNKGA